MRLSPLCFFLHSANMVPADKDDEKSLITLACEGNGLATHTLYRLHVRYLTAICSRYVANKEDVKDVLQSSFLKIFIVGLVRIPWHRFIKGMDGKSGGKRITAIHEVAEQADL